MGWWKKITGGIKKIFNKVTKVVKKIVGKIGDVGKKIWGGVKKFAGKAGKIFTKLGPVANLAMNFIPGFGQLWQAYGIWGQMAKGAITGYLSSGGNVKGALLGAAGAAAGDWYSKLQGNSLSEKMGNVLKLNKGTESFTKNLSKYAGKFDPYVGNAGRSSDAYGFAEVELNKNLQGTNYWNNRAMTMNGGEYADGLTLKPDDYSQYMSQVDIDAQNYNPAVDDPTQKKNKPFKLPTFGTEGDGGVAGYFAGDTSPLTAYNTATGRLQGQIGTGTDTYDVRQLGLLEKARLIDDASRTFQTA